MKFYNIDKDYLRYLQSFDSNVPNFEYIGRMKCYLGVILKTKDNMEYFAPLTSYKSKFLNMNNDIDFYKIEDKQTHKIFGALDINNMIPVTEKNYTELTFDNLSSFRIFDNQREQKNYWKLLTKELSLINEQVVLANAEKLYRYINLHPDSSLASRCCNFSLLEKKCKDYSKYNVLSQCNDFDVLKENLNEDDLLEMNEVLNDYESYMNEHINSNPNDYIDEYGNEDIIYWYQCVTSTKDFLDNYKEQEKDELDIE